MELKKIQTLRVPITGDKDPNKMAIRILYPNDDRDHASLHLACCHACRGRRLHLSLGQRQRRQ